MRFTVRAKDMAEEKGGILAFPFFQVDGREAPTLDAQAAAADKAAGGRLKEAFRTGAFSGAKGETHVLPGAAGAELLLVGLGKEDKADLEALRVASAAAIKKADRLDGDRLVSALHRLELPGTSLSDRAEAVAVGLVLGRYRFERFKGKKDDDEPKKTEIKQVVVHAIDAGETRSLKPAIERGQAIAESQWLARDLANTPGNVATPTWMANEAKKVARKLGLKVTVLGPAEMKKHKMGGILSVAQGSEEPPRLVILEHRAKEQKAKARTKPLKTVALVGKGITFDSGGISLKPGAGMELMKYDKCGACAVIGTMAAVARLDLPLNVIGICALSENMPSGKAYKPGDIITCANGKTVEILNTDAEGRMVLSDALWYAHRYKPDTIVDVATLTGAIDVALGRHYSGLMGSDEDLIAELRKAGETSGERMWHMPLGDGYQDQIKGSHSDLLNIGGRGGGALTAGQFLRNFVEEDKVKWAHLDIAATAWVESDAPYTPKGCTGVGVRALTTFLRGRAN